MGDRSRLRTAEPSAARSPCRAADGQSGEDNVAAPARSRAGASAGFTRPVKLRFYRGFPVREAKRL